MTPAETPYKAELIARHMIGVQLRTVNYRNGLPVSAQETHYGMFSLPADPSNPNPPAVGGNTLLPRYVFAKKGDNAFERKVSFDSYDSRANITQYTPDAGAPVSIIWGYRNSLPVAKIENMAFSALPAALVTQIQLATHAQLPQKLEELRTHTALAGAMLSAYTYRPLVGNDTEIDPKGSKISYRYDTFGRLEEVRDTCGNLISHNRYQYRTQN
ncbi:hypothetical protein H9W95_02255 [Flavobacterium lindanitolerans]|nr:hypothetical protein [Flavobacterium lindanitolerans]